jgi:hypothetical protein
MKTPILAKAANLDSSRKGIAANANVTDPGKAMYLILPQQTNFSFFWQGRI